MSSLTTLSGAIQLKRYGPPEVLEYASIQMPALGARDIRIKVVAAAVNHTDLEIRAGNWRIRKDDPFPYVPGVEAVGVVQERGSAVHEWVIGQNVITMMQGLGGVRAERNGGYSEFVTVDADVVAPIPPGIDPLAMAALGLAGVTAHRGLRKIGQLGGKRILVTGATGGVGSAAVSIAHAQNAHVIAIATRATHADHLRVFGAAEVIIVEKGADLRIEPQSVDGVLDCVAGTLFNPCARALRAGGVLSLVGATAGGDVNFDAWQLIRPITLTGYSSEDLDGESLRESIAALSKWMLEDSLRVPQFQVMDLFDAALAHRLLEEKQVVGRVLLNPR